MSPQLQQKAQTLGTLLAESQMPEKLKQAVLDNTQYLTEAQVDALISSLKEEEDSVDRLQEAVSVLEKFYEKSFEDLQKEQRSVADEFVEEELKNIDKEDQIEKIKSDIDSGNL